MPYDKSLSASLDVDGRKQFDTVMSVKRHDIKYGFVWIPHAYWVVDNERVAELLDVDGRKQFDTVMSVKRHDIKYGFVWIPHAYWVVDNERVAELSGE
ncbi:hypothetical protein PYW07_010498 [Mythimna separata]|uniref:Uncharacterized protein n=1 Tax=Mythimna separata TaxID=271217 RepID=A0AAD7YAA6_MYTSE|nr:hypothetical protein PYW07_010493 [Mythimna separata]KAJ8708369.1 hypothetical protein PYW07_010494 [Mythimna separata]KAJ8708370.1 hypothetical protein PYW07_010495 [Mythimna separata]KAJ8708371.1 hypothetical protein PYW07_010496 [Mythimna separata]KAJ8708372.1 hypothetical protein PYW07_010497 [Mythimna separata]